MNKTTKTNWLGISLRNSKKAIMYEFIVRLVIALVMVTSAILIGKSFFRLSDEALDSYNELVKEIGDIKEGELRSMPLIMDKETAMIGFSKNSPSLKKIWWKYLEGLYLKREAYFKRPNSCSINNSCLCLCREGWESTYIDESTTEYSCEKIICNDFQTDFLKKMTEQEFGLITEDQSDVVLSKNGKFPADSENLEDPHFPTGFLFVRDVTYSHFPEKTERRFTTYFERYKNKIGICFKSPCFSEQTKKEIDAKLLDIELFGLEDE